MNNPTEICRDLNGFVLNELGRRKGDWPAISQACGVPYFTISKIVTGATGNPKIRTIQRLANYFIDNPIAA